MGATNGNVFAAILAGGSGTRMGNPDKPKQFLMLGDKPILIHTIEKFCLTGDFECVVVLCPKTWLQQTRDLIGKYASAYADMVVVAEGGAQRNDTVENAIDYIESHFETDEDTIIVTHDAVRPFVTYRIIQENIEAARKVGACDTVIPASDTIVESTGGDVISNIPERKNYYQGQTPQSFNLNKLKRLVSGLSDQEKAVLTDACKIFVLRNEPVALVLGETTNMKITYPQDMRLAGALLED